MDKGKIIKFRAVKVVKQPTIVHFITKDGQSVSFTATKGVEKKVNISFKTKGNK